MKIRPGLRIAILGCLALARVLGQSTCVTFPSGFIPFSSISYVTAANPAGDHLVVGVPAPGALSAIGNNVPAPAFVNQTFCDGQVQLAPQQFYPNVYVPTAAELEQHFRTVAQATALPIMLYNNPPAYRVNIELATLVRLAEEPNIVAIKESAPDPRRFTDVINEFGERFVLFAGLDDVAFEGLVLGAKGWVSGLTNAFPAESLALYAAIRTGDLARARSIYRWFMPLLHLDAEHDLVQSIKLAEEIMGRGSERVRPPRLPLAGARRAAVTAMVERARANRPVID